VTRAAQRIEVSFSGGYSASERITSGDRLLLGQQYDGLDIDSGRSMTLTYGAHAHRLDAVRKSPPRGRLIGCTHERSRFDHQ